MRKGFLNRGVQIIIGIAHFPFVKDQQVRVKKNIVDKFNDT
jgi:hypothetical protein